MASESFSYSEYGIEPKTGGYLVIARYLVPLADSDENSRYRTHDRKEHVFAFSRIDEATHFIVTLEAQLRPTPRPAA